MAQQRIPESSSGAFSKLASGTVTLGTSEEQIVATGVTDRHLTVDALARSTTSPGTFLTVYQGNPNDGTADALFIYPYYNGNDGEWYVSIETNSTEQQADYEWLLFEAA